MSEKAPRRYRRYGEYRMSDCDWFNMGEKPPEYDDTPLPEAPSVSTVSDGVSRIEGSHP